MEWSKLKNIILLILVTTNLFLLALMGSREWNAARYQANARSDAIQVLARSNISVDKDILPKDSILPLGSLSRDRAEEAALLTPLLGAVTEQSVGGGRYLYAGEKGSADLRSRGGFIVTLDPGQFPVSGGYSAHAVETLALMGVEARVVGSQPLPGGGTEVTLVQLWDETPVLTCAISAVYGAGELVSLSGTRLFGEPADAGKLELSTVTGLLRFLEQFSAIGDVCNEVTSMSPAYQLITGLSDPARLDPVWYIETDTGSYILDVATAGLQRL